MELPGSFSWPREGAAIVADSATGDAAAAGDSMDCAGSVAAADAAVDADGGDLTWVAEMDGSLGAAISLEVLPPVGTDVAVAVSAIGAVAASASRFDAASKRDAIS